MTWTVVAVCGVRKSQTRLSDFHFDFFILVFPIAQMVKKKKKKKQSACNAGYPGLIPGFGRSPREGKGNPFHYSCLDRGAWWATVHGAAKSLI